MPTKLNEQVVRSLPAPKSGNKVWYFPGATLQGKQAPRGFGVRVTAGGARSFVMNFRVKGREHRYTIGAFPDWSVVRAVREARTLRERIDRGENPLDARKPVPAMATVASVLDDFIARHARNKSHPLRSADEYEKTFKRLVKPRIGKLGIHELRRSDIIGLLDAIEDNNGPVMADRTLAYLRKALNWYATRDDRFNTPIVRGMSRTKPKERARTRVLSDDEIRAIWPVLGDAGTFGALVKTLLLTAQRRDEVATMRRQEIDADGVWTIPAERYKTKRPNVVPLSDSVLEIIRDQPQVEGCSYVFPSRSGTPFSGFGKSKAALDKAVLAAQRSRAPKGTKVEPIPNWTLHDLRRTAKTLMVRAGVRPDISERVLGHVIAGVEGTYDRHSYLHEKRDALEKLAEMIERILKSNPRNLQTVIAAAQTV